MFPPLSLCFIMIRSIWIIQRIIYLFSIAIFFLGGNIIRVWVLIELNLLSFLFFIFFLEGEGFSFSIWFYYFLVQSAGSFLFLSFVCFNDLEIYFDFKRIFLLASISVKIGLLPFFFWVFTICPLMYSRRLFVFLTFQKIPYFLIFFRLSPDCEVLCFFTFIIGRQIVFWSESLYWLLITSSIRSVVWILLLFLDSLHSFFLFFFVYTISLFFLTFFDGLWIGYSLGGIKFDLVLKILFIFCVGLPPFSLFLFKIDIVKFLNLLGKDIGLLIMFFYRIVSLSGYFKYFFKDLYSIYLLYDFNLSWTKSKVFYLFIRIVPFLFIFL